MFEQIRELGARAQRKGGYLALDAARKLRLAPPKDHFLSPASYFRMVQNLREHGERQNPDGEVWRFMSPVERMLARVEEMQWTREWPFYHYLLARTRFYDEAVTAAIADGFTQLMIFGVGGDTRALRFRDGIDKAGMRVIESDLTGWIERRAAMTRAMNVPRDYRHVAINLDSVDYAALAAGPHFDRARKTLFLAEGVTQYIRPASFEALVRFIGQTAAPGSRFAFDVKYAAADPAPVSPVFRMPGEPGAARRLLEEGGLRMNSEISSVEAHEIYAPYPSPRYEEDGLIVAERPQVPAGAASGPQIH